MFDITAFDGHDNLSFFGDTTQDLNGFFAAPGSRPASVRGASERPQS